MAGIKFKQAYEETPTAGDNLADENYIPVEKDAGAGSTSWGIRLSQLVSYLTGKFYTKTLVDQKDAQVAQTAQDNLTAHTSASNPHGITPAGIGASPDDHVHAALEVTYDNTDSGISATDVKGALDELKQTAQSGVIVYSKTVPASVPGTSNVWDDVNAHTFTGDYTTAGVLNIQTNHVVTIVHDGTAYNWVGGAPIDIGATSGTTTTSADYVGSGGVTDHEDLTSIGTKTHDEIEADLTTTLNHIGENNPHPESASVDSLTAHTDDPNPHTQSASKTELTNHANLTSTAHGGLVAPADVVNMVSAPNAFTNPYRILLSGIASELATDPRSVRDSLFAIQQELIDNQYQVPTSHAVFVETSYLRSEIDSLKIPEYFQVAIASNTNIASISGPSSDTYTHYLITENEAVPEGEDLPTLPVYPGNFVEGVIPSSYDLVTSDSRALRLYIYDADGAATVIRVPTGELDEQGNETYVATVVPSYTTPPSIITDFQATNLTSSSFTANFTAATSPSGTVTHELWRRPSNGNPDALVKAPIVNSDVVDNLTPDFEMTFFIKAIDEKGYSSLSNFVTVTLPAALSGTIAIEQSTYEIEESNGGQLDIDLVLVGRTSGETVSVNVRTIDHTAQAGVNYTAIPDTTTVSFAPGSDRETVSIIVSLENGTGMSLNKVAQLEIVPGSEATDGVELPAIAAYPGNATLFEIKGSIAPEGNARDQEETAPSSGIWNIVMEAESYESLDNKGKTGCQGWSLLEPSDDYQTEDFTGATGAGVITGGCASEKFFSMEEAIGNGDPDNGAPRLHYRINMRQTGIHYVWMRKRASSYLHGRTWIGMDLVDSFSNPDCVHSYESPSRNRWVKYDATYNCTVLGEHILTIYKRDIWANVDKILLTNSNVYTPIGEGASDPQGGDSEGPPETALTTAIVPDDPYNPAEPTNPNPGTAPYAVESITPANGAIGVSTSTQVVATWPEGAILNSDVQIVVKDSDNNIIVGTTS
jgi:hypothetical protein